MAHESLTGGPVVLLLGGLLIGVLIGKDGWEELKPFAKYPFKGHSLPVLARHGDGCSAAH